jgi:anti-sigma B factor antagonist
MRSRAARSAEEGELEANRAEKCGQRSARRAVHSFSARSGEAHLRQGCGERSRNFCLRARRASAKVKRSEVHLVSTVRQVGAKTIVSLKGAMMAGETEENFRQQVRSLTESGRNRLAIDLAGVTEMDSWGIGSLVRQYLHVKRAGGTCVFFAPPRHVLHLLKTAKLDSIIEIVETEQDALSRI